MVVNLSWFHPAWLVVGGLVFVPLFLIRERTWAARWYPALVAGALGLDERRPGDHRRHDAERSAQVERTQRVVATDQAAQRRADRDAEEQGSTHQPHHPPTALRRPAGPGPTSCSS